MRGNNPPVARGNSRLAGGSSCTTVVLGQKKQEAEPAGPAQPCSPLAAELRVHSGDGHEIAAAQVDAIVGIHGAHLQRRYAR